MELTDEQVEFKEVKRDLFKQMNNLFLGYESRYSGAFDLQDTFKSDPRMCALTTTNLTNGVNYYRGKETFKYIVSQESSDGNGVISKMDTGPDWLF
jgi:hypothetical protein